jgi:hypothetical protein
MSTDPSDGAFDLRTRAELALACEPGGPPAGLLRSTPLLARRGVRGAAAAALLAASVAGALLWMRPPELVRGAIEHEYYERTLRGTFMDAKPLLQHLGLGHSTVVPGFPQLMRPCDIDGHLVYHLTTFFEKGGMVTVFAFHEPMRLKEGSGWWGNVYWQVVSSRDGRPLVMIAQQRHALQVALAHLGLTGRPPT